MQMRVEYDHIQNLLSQVTYKFTVMPDTTTTYCAAMLGDWKLATGESSCVHATEFNAARGEQIAQARARKEAEDTLWQLEGYLLHITGKTSDKH